MNVERSDQVLAQEVESAERELDALSRTLEATERQAALIAVEYEARVGRWERRRRDAARRFARAQAAAVPGASAALPPEEEDAAEGRVPSVPAWGAWREAPAPAGQIADGDDQAALQARLVLVQAGIRVMRDRIASLQSSAPYCYREWLADEAAVNERVAHLRNDIAGFEAAAAAYERKRG